MGDPSIQGFRLTGLLPDLNHDYAGKICKILINAKNMEDSKIDVKDENSTSVIDIESDDDSKLIGGLFLTLGICMFIFFLDMAFENASSEYGELPEIVLPIIMGSCGLLFLGPIGIHISSKSPLRIDKSGKVVEKNTVFYGKNLKTTTIHFDEIQRIERSGGTDNDYSSGELELGASGSTYIIAGTPPIKKYIQIRVGTESAKLIAETVGVQYVDLRE